MSKDANMNWTMFTKRTEDPKLAWLESRLALAGIPSRRRGSSFHAPILEVPEGCLDAAHAILAPVDDIPDDESFWADDPDGCSCGAPEDGPCAFCQVKAVIETHGC